MDKIREVRVVVVYTDELESISVDGIEMEDIHAIRNKPIRDWFTASNGRDGWEGLITEIEKFLDDEQAELNFEFQGPQESKYVFEECIAKLGFGSKADGLEVEDIAERNMEEAAKAEHRGLYKRALDCYVNAADFGNVSEAQYIAAEYYYRCYKGEQSSIDISKEDAIANAVEYYEKAALQGDARAQYRLYELFSKGEDVKKDRDEAIRWLTMAAESGDVIRQMELGDFCINQYEGDDEKKTYDIKGLEWYHKAAETGCVEAYIQLGRCYCAGLGTEKDEEQGIAWYKKAVEKGALVAQFYLAECYFNGQGVEKNDALAFEWYKKVAEQNSDSVAEWGTEYDPERYIIRAQYKLGDCYRNGYGVEIDQKNAFEWFLKVANCEYNDCDEVMWAQNSVGYRYEYGKGIEKNLELAVEWYQKSAENGCNKAQCNLGSCYEYGTGVEKDLKESYKWYKKSAENDWPRGQYCLGWCYEHGRGIEKDVNSAYEWYKKSAENDDPLGQCRLGYCYNFAIGIEKDYVKAMEWYKKAIDNGNVRAIYLLGQCYEYGTGVNKDPDKAREYYEKAFADGNIDAANRLMLGEVKELCVAFYNNGWKNLVSLDSGKNLVSVYKLDCKEIFLIYDGSLTKNGKAGFVITDKGIYYRDLFIGKCELLTYQMLHDVNFEWIKPKPKNDIYVKIGDHDILWGCLSGKGSEQERHYNAQLELADFFRSIATVAKKYLV